MRRVGLLSIFVVPALVLVVALLVLPARADDPPPLDVSWIKPARVNSPEDYLWVYDYFQKGPAGSSTVVNDYWLRIPITYYYNRVNLTTVTFNYELSHFFTQGAGNFAGHMKFIPPQGTKQFAVTCSTDEMIQNDSEELKFWFTNNCDSGMGSATLSGSPSSFNFTREYGGSMSVNGIFSFAPWPQPPAGPVCTRKTTGWSTWTWGQPDPVYPSTLNTAGDAVDFVWSGSYADGNDVYQLEVKCKASGIVAYPFGLPMGTPTITPTMSITGTVTPTATYVVTWPTPVATLVPSNAVPIVPIVTVVVPTLWLPTITPDPVGITVGKPTGGGCFVIIPAFGLDQWILQWHVAFGLPEQKFCVNESTFNLEVFGFNLGVFAMVLSVIGGLGVLYRIIKS